MANRTQQNKILAAAEQDGTLPTLYWYMTGRQRNREVPAAVGDSIPVQPAGPDVETSRQWAHLMLETARMMTPGLTLDLELTATDLLDGLRWHVWSEVDMVCPGCGAINEDCVCVAVREVTGE